MTCEAPTSPAGQPNWYLDNGEVEVGPLMEVELRKRLASAAPADLEVMRVRQGNSSWHPATQILARFRELARNGVYLKVNEATQGPFTPERAVQLLRQGTESEGQSGEIFAKIGLKGQWMLSSAFLKAMDRLQARDRLGGENSARNEMGLAKAILIEEPDFEGQSSLESPSLRAEESTQFFEASLVVDEDADSESVADNTRPRKLTESSLSVGVEHQLDEPKSPGIYDTIPQSVPAISPPEYPRPIVRSPSTLNKQAQGPVPWIVISVTGVACILLLVGTLYFVMGWNSAGPSADVGQRDAKSGKLEEESGAASLSLEQPARPPTITVGMVFRPEFETTLGIVDAGIAFAARLPGSDRPIVLSALHLFGPSGGMARQVAATELPGIWDGLSLSDCVTQRKLGSRPGRALRLDSAKPYPAVSEVGDVIAYLPESIDGLKPLKLSEEKPAQGDRVWLMSEVVSGPGLVHAATVEGLDKGFLVYRFDDPSLSIVATSGAPVVNGKQEVVAVHVAGGQLSGDMIGMGTPTYKFFEPLARAAGLR